MDEETKAKLAEIESIKRTLDTPGWEVIENRINGLIEDICDIRNIDKEAYDTTEKRLHQMEVREGASELVSKWVNILKSEAEWSKPEKIEDELSDKIYTQKD